MNELNVLRNYQHKRLDLQQKRLRQAEKKHSYKGL
jgi:hypothetical protein